MDKGRIKNILFAADTFKECNQFLNDLANDLFEKGIIFDINKRAMSIKTKNARLICASETSSYSGLFQRPPFDYYIFTGYARWEEHGFHKLCISRTKIGAKEIDDMNDLIRVMLGEEMLNGRGNDNKTS